MSKLDYSAGHAHEEWLGRVTEEILEPELEIVDAHHHLWIRDGAPYLFDELEADLASGHRIVSTVFAECHSMYRAGGPAEERSVGETEFVSGIAAMSASGQYSATRVCEAMFGNVDLGLGEAVDSILDLHIAAAGERFRGVRLSCGWDEGIRSVADRPGVLLEDTTQAAIGVLADKNLSLDVWLYHPQLDEVAQTAAAYPGITIVLNHIGTPILGGPYKGREDEVMSDWRRGIERVAEHDNVVMKLGAIPMRRAPDVDRSRPPGSAEAADAWRPWIEGCIEAFGANRCLFESNFPVQKNWTSYAVVWNAYKRIVSGASDADKRALFAGTAQRAYRLTT